jgi:hypothetical protein
MIMWFAENLGVSNEKRCKIIGYSYSYNIWGGEGSVLPPNTNELLVIRYLHAIDDPRNCLIMQNY